MLPQFIPFFTDAQGKVSAPQVELALALATAMQKREETGIPFVRRAVETPTVVAKITWPILMRRAFSDDRVLLFDKTGIFGEKMTLPVSPEFSVSDEMCTLHEDDSFSSNLMSLAQAYAEIKQWVYDSHVVTLFSGLGEALTKDHNMLENAPWGFSLPVSEQNLMQVSYEESQLRSWLIQFNEEEARLVALLTTLRDMGQRRIDYYEGQKDKALRLLNEEISTIEPQVNQQLGNLKQQYELLQQQKESVHARIAELGSQIELLQQEQAPYQGKSQPMFAFYAERMRKIREEMRSLTEQEEQSDADAMDEYSARKLLLRRPLSVLEQQRKLAEMQWQNAIGNERDLIKTLTDIFQESRLAFQLAIKELLGRSQVVGVGYPEELHLELPFIIIRLQSLTSSRYIVIPPSHLKPAGQISAFFTGLIGSVRLPVTSRNTCWEEIARFIEDQLNRQKVPGWFYDVLLQKNEISEETCWSLAQDGLQQMLSSGLINERMREQLQLQFDELREAARVPHPVENPPEIPEEE